MVFTLTNDYVLVRPPSF